MSAELGRILGRGRAQALPHHRREGLALAYVQDASRGQTDDARPARGCKCGRKGYGLAQSNLLDCGLICLLKVLDRVQPEVVAAGLHKQCLTVDWLHFKLLCIGNKYVLSSWSEICEKLMLHLQCSIQLHCC